MHLDELLAAALVLSLPALLIGGAILGSRLSPTARRRVELLVLAPVLLVIWLAGFGAALWMRRWGEAAFLVLMLGLISLGAARRYLRQ